MACKTSNVFTASLVERWKQKKENGDFNEQRFLIVLSFYWPIASIFALSKTIETKTFSGLIVVMKSVKRFEFSHISIITRSSTMYNLASIHFILSINHFDDLMIVALRVSFNTKLTIKQAIEKCRHRIPEFLIAVHIFEFIRKKGDLQCCALNLKLV